ncbi:MAG: UDP-2,3-diacylglucosamine diphosphatase LpxI [Candidatus Tectomicrobia bacterium]|uniref:UDP-2,3-diacylglucosamine diphosphatase LpxI n=1 Tax=Tectimicrobiota bacterium TaxID=2528274 RepID=A0A932HXX2_UNCTE|nr:UDP-2,3-diacylglucosamine diphosphatase LpxI [Candidatus Tectomicrobia bacterium]
MAESPERIGLIAGSGALAGEFLSSARGRGCEVAVAALSESVRRELEPGASAIAHLPPSQPKKIIRFFHSAGVERVAFAGKVEKRLLFQTLRFDLDALRFIQRARNLADVTIMDEVVRYAEENGLRVLPQTEYLGHLLAPEGPIGRRRLKEAQRKDAAYAIRMAREIARLDIGQTVVVRKGAVVAVEAVEGTDEAIRRGCRLAGKGALVCKAARPKQDLRYDIPVVGPGTLDAVREGGASALLVEAGRTFLLERERLAREADAAGVALAGWSGEGEP